MSSADYKPFSGFVAADGTIHKTQAEVETYAYCQKVKKALLEFAETIGDATSVSCDDRGHGLVFVTDLPDFLLAHRGQILTAFAQEVRARPVRADKGFKRAPRVKKSAAPATGASA